MRLREMRALVGASIRLDLATAALADLPARSRLDLVAGKLWRLPALAAGRPVRVRVGGGTYRAATISDLGTLQSSIADVFRELVAPGVLDPRGAPVVVDVGANIGQFALAVKLACPASDIICLEPDPDTWQALCRNTGGAVRIRTVCTAAGATAGSLPLYRHELSVMSSLRPPAGRSGYDTQRTVDVAVTTLDEATRDLACIDLVKIDVEGFEADVLRGAPQTLARARYLLMELTFAPGNLAVFDLIHEVAPQAAILRFGRPLGERRRPVAQDVLIRLR